MDRTTLRTVVPPVLALGLVALLTHPVDALPSPTSTLPSTGATAARGGVQARVPGVAFQQQLRVVDGRLRTAVLVNVAAPAGRATVRELPGCAVALTPGVVGWLDCAYAGRAAVTIDVVLADGERVTRSDVPVRG
ncbi:MAG TPA: hypothetical protein VFL59_08180 [Candidatus Nanopelagicales bacterium]|nr:hypothetical protein [Candidatus Nanopelagicales bacterium]